jgi:hypothetical protein
MFKTNGSRNFAAGARSFLPGLNKRCVIIDAKAFGYVARVEYIALKRKTKQLQIRGLK